MCHLHIVIEQVQPDLSAVDGWLKKKKEEGESNACSTPGAPSNSIMYEVITDQTMWAVCGRTSGKKLHF